MTEDELRSHDFAFWGSDEPLENDQAAEIYSALEADGVSERVKPSPKIALIAQQIEAR